MRLLQVITTVVLFTVFYQTNERSRMDDGLMVLGQTTFLFICETQQNDWKCVSDLLEARGGFLLRSFLKLKKSDSWLTDFRVQVTCVGLAAESAVSALR